jgi:hypothetical protein
MQGYATPGMHFGGQFIRRFVEGPVLRAHFASEARGEWLDIEACDQTKIGT